MSAAFALGISGCILEIPVNLGEPIELVEDELAGVWLGAGGPALGASLAFGTGGSFAACQFPVSHLVRYSNPSGEEIVSFDGAYTLRLGSIYAGTNAPLGGNDAELIIINSYLVDDVTMLRMQAGGNPDSSDVISFTKADVTEPSGDDPVRC